MAMVRKMCGCMKSVVCLALGFMAATNKELQLGIWSSVWMFNMHNLFFVKYYDVINFCLTINTNRTCPYVISTSQK